MRTFGRAGTTQTQLSPEEEEGSTASLGVDELSIDNK
jgi:hypothetical protein